jgi:hypothetical protein
MNRTVAAVVFLVSLSLLGLQLSGLHMHVDDHGYSGAAHGAHVHDAAGAHTHGAAVDPHDHSHDTDVAVFELGAIAAKHLVFLIAASVVLFALVRIMRSELWLGYRSRRAALHHAQKRVGEKEDRSSAVGSSAMSCFTSNPVIPASRIPFRP